SSAATQLTRSNCARPRQPAKRDFTVTRREALDGRHAKRPRTAGVRGGEAVGQLGMALMNCDNDSAAVPSPPRALLTSLAAPSGLLMTYHAAKAMPAIFMCFLFTATTLCGQMTTESVAQRRPPGHQRRAKRRSGPYFFSITSGGIGWSCLIASKSRDALARSQVM